MIPKGLGADVKLIQSEQPSQTYKINVGKNRVVGFIENDLEAVEQAIYKILSTERYQHEIYDNSYGVELADLFGMQIPYIYPEITNRIKDALTQDDRIQSVDAFLFDKKKGVVSVTFTVHTIYGDVKAKKEVRI